MRKKKIPPSRINIILGFFFTAYLLIIVRLFNIQVLGHEKYSSLAQDQYWKLQEIPPKRGDISSFDGFILAGTGNNYLLFVKPAEVLNQYEFAHNLADILSGIRFTKLSEGDETTEEEIFNSYYQRFLEILSLDLKWAILEKGLLPEEKSLIETFEIEGIGFEEEPVRYYPEKSLASHILGFVASNNEGEPTGYFGIEGILNEDLKGKAGRVTEEVDATGIPILTGNYKKVDSIPGRDVKLTVNRAIQYVVEKKLKEGVQKYNAVSGTVIVMDPFTGEILALANYPTYVPNDFLTEEVYLEEAPYRKNIEKINLAISQTYEPGSVTKPLTISSAIDLGLVTPNTTFNDRGPVQYSDYVVDNWDGKHHGIQTIRQLLQKSNNIGAAWVGHKVGREKLYEYLTRFGLGTKAGIELEGEDTGVIRDYTAWTDIDLATAAFGQGISATPLQVLNSFNVIANGGYLLQPKIISQISDGTKVVEIPTKNIRKVISKETSEIMVDLLESAALEGEAKFFVLKSYKIAGKTGTAQIPVAGKYDPKRTNATFAGFMAGSKKFSMLVKLEEPKSSVYAAETAVPLWMDITQELVKIFGLPPDRTPETLQDSN